MSPRERRSPSNSPAGEKDLSPHPLAPRLEEVEPEADGLTTLRGFIGESRKGGRVRVYLDLSGTSYCEVAADDVVRTAPVDANDQHSPTTVWIKESAQVNLVQVSRLSGEASFIKGALRNRYGGQELSAAANRVVLPASDYFWDCLPPPPPPPGTSWTCFSKSIPCPEPSGMFCY
jgi:hypothetical protein